MNGITPHMLLVQRVGATWSAYPTCLVYTQKSKATVVGLEKLFSKLNPVHRAEFKNLLNLKLRSFLASLETNGQDHRLAEGRVHLTTV